MRILICGDLHIRDYSHISKRRNDDVKKVLDTIVQTMDRQDIPNLILTGDIFHSRYEIDTMSLDLFNQMVRNIRQMNRKIFIVPGNHDMMTRDNKQFWFRSYPEIKTVFFDHNDIRSLYVEELPGVAFIPYMEDKLVLQEIVKLLTLEEEIKLIVGHFGIDKMATHMGFEDPHAVQISQIPTSKLMVLGHYHKPASMAKGMIRYIGTPYATTFGESNLQDSRSLIVVSILGNSSPVVEESVPIDIPDLISCTDEEYHNTYKDARDFPYVKVEGRVGQETEGPNIVARKVSLKEEIPNFELDLTDTRSTILSYFENNSKLDTTKVMKIVDQIIKKVRSNNEIDY